MSASSSVTAAHSGTPRVNLAPSLPTGSASKPLFFGSNIPMAVSIGLVGEQIGDGFSRIRLPYNAAYTNNRGDLHGGVLLTLLDVTLACAGRGHDPVNVGVITVDVSTHFIASANTDVIGEGRCLRRGRSLAFSQAEVFDLKGNLLATATATLKLVAANKEPS